MEDDIIVGECYEMCPKDERDFRQRKNLLHRFEMCTIARNSRGRMYKADVMKTVKCFTRPAVGVSSPGPTLLRPGPVLIKTVHYLINEIVPHFQENGVDVYDFVTDRMRAVRQDMTIQRLPPDECLKIVEPMIRFHVLFGYLLCEDKKFEFHLNLIYLQECILKAFECYPLLIQDITHDQHVIESIFTCLNINNPEIVLSKINYFNGKHFELLKALLSKNFVRFFQLSMGLDLFSKAALAIHVPEIRMRSGLFTFCHAFSSNNSSYPIDRICNIFLYNSAEEVFSDCDQLGIRYNNEYCFFNKKDLLPTPKSAVMKHWWTVENDIVLSDLSQVLLNL